MHRIPQLFRGLGRAVDEYTIQLKPGAVPFALPTPRRVAIPLLKTVKAELENMKKLGVISRIDTPTDWCARMVVVPKTNGRVRICVDLTQLNKNVRRERHPYQRLSRSWLRLPKLVYSPSSMQILASGRSH